MADKMSEVYELYDADVLQSFRGRGAIILRTGAGLFQLKTPDVNESRLKAEYALKEKLCEAGFEQIDRCVANKNGELATFDRYGTPYVMRCYYDGRECNVNDEKEVMLAVDNLARLHMTFRNVFSALEGDVHIRTCSDFRRKNQEMKRVYNFVLKKGQKKLFEEEYLKAYTYFYGQGLACREQYGASYDEEQNEHLGYCHGMYDHHSILVLEHDGGKELATVNFDRFYVGNQLYDLYHFIRKTVEKNDYSFELLCRMLERYAEKVNITTGDLEYIYTLYLYPEKFYKLSNQYMNSSKKRLSPKLYDKLTRIISEEKKKEALLEKFRAYIDFVQ